MNKLLTQSVRAFVVVVVGIELDHGEAVWTEEGAIMLMEGDVEMVTNASGGLMGGLKRMVAGKSFLIPSSVHQQKYKGTSFLAGILFVVLILLMAPVANAGCTVELRAKWTGIPQGSTGVIMLKGYKQKARVKIKGGSWSPLLSLGRPSQREVIFYPDGRFKDSHVWGKGGWSVVNSGRGTWRFTKKLRLGCKYLRQYSFLAEVRKYPGGTLGGGMVYFPNQGKFTPPNTTIIDFGDLGRFGWRYK